MAGLIVLRDHKVGAFIEPRDIQAWHAINHIDFATFQRRQPRTWIRENLEDQAIDCGRTALPEDILIAQA